MRSRARAAALLAAAGLLAVAGGVGAQEYVVMGTPHVNLRTGPGTDFVVVGKAQKGDVFPVTGETDGWWEIRLFSGEPRYVSKAVRVYPLAAGDVVPEHGLVLPESQTLCNSVFRSVLMGLDRAEREAEELLPRGVDAARHDALRRVLEDRILLEMFHIYGLQAPVFGALMAMEW